MMQLTFGESIKIILSRRGITIKTLAEMIEEKTGKKMSRQNLTQRLARDNFQEQDMRMIAEVLGYAVQLSLVQKETGQAEALSGEESAVLSRRGKMAARRTLSSYIESEESEREITIGELVDFHEELEGLEGDEELERRELINMLNQEIEELNRERKPGSQKGTSPKGRSFRKIDMANVIRRYFHKEQPVIDQEPIQISGEMIEKNDEEQINRAILEEAAYHRAQKEEEKDKTDVSGLGAECINPYTDKEYETNSVRVHPSRIGYVQVYDRSDHKWADMTEWAFMAYQERKKALLGKEYEPPVYLD